MEEIEELLQICADSMKMPGWNDALSMMAERAEGSCKGRLLSDDELANVAGGRTNDDPSGIQGHNTDG